MKKIALAAFLLLALLALSLRAAGPTCSMPMRGMTARQCADCCAAMKSCILPKQNPTNAVTADSPSQADLTALPFAPVFLHDLAATPSSYAAVVVPRTRPTPTRLAVLCTFLI